MSEFNQDNSNLDLQNDDSQLNESKKKLTDMQLRIIQAIAGILCAAALVLSMYIPTSLVENRVIESDSLINYAFVVVFLIIMVGRRSIENKYRLRLGLFSLALINGILIGILLYAIRIFNNPKSGAMYELDNTYKALIIVGVILIVLVLGVLLPYLRYKKRLENGTLTPIRIPEKPHQPTSADNSPVEDDGPLTVEQKIAAMMRDIESPPNENTDNKDKTE